MEWIKCSERLPDDNKMVLVFEHDKNGDGGSYNIVWGWSVDVAFKRGITSHWMPLPKPPKES